MHISEGVLSMSVAISGWGVSALILSYSIFKLKEENISKIALISALFFVASMVYIPIGVTSIHFMLLGIIGVFLGKDVFLALFIALLLQALLLGFGGISSLGINALNISLGAISGYYLNTILKDKLHEKLLYFLLGFIPILVASLFLAISLWLSSSEFLAISKLAFSLNLPLALIEGIISIFIFSFLKKLNLKI